MVNGLGVVGWGVGGIEAEAAMLGQPISMLIPEVVGFRLVDRLPEGATATDLVLTITERLRKLGVVGKFVEFYGPGLEFLTIADRATLGNMSPEYGATIAICPIDDMTLDYLRLTGRDEAHVQLVEAYAKEQGLFRTAGVAGSGLHADASSSTSRPSSRASPGPKRPQDRVSLRQSKLKFQQALEVMLAERKPKAAATAEKPARTARRSRDRAAAGGRRATSVAPGMEGLDHGSVVVAAITSCTNTSNPSVMIGAGLLARNAVKRGLEDEAVGEDQPRARLARSSPNICKAAGLLEYLAELGFNIVGYGCTTCIGNSGPLPEPVSSIVKDSNLVVASVLSGNRNFEGRIQSQVRANYLASPPLVVAYALAGRMQIDLTTEPLGNDSARAAGVPEGHLADASARSRRRCCSSVQVGDVPRAVRARVRRRRAVALAADPDRRAVRVDGRLDLHPQPAVLRRHHARADAASRHPRRARARRARRQRHDRSHLAGRIDSGRQPGRAST